MVKTLILIEVEHPDAVTPDDVAGAINKMLDIGYADACETCESPQLRNEDAVLAASLTIGQPEAVERQL